MSCWNQDQQLCASCRYWAGRREIDFTGYHFNALEQTSSCQKPLGPFRGIMMSEGSYCPKWEPFENR